MTHAPARERATNEASTDPRQEASTPPTRTLRHALAGAIVLVLVVAVALLADGQATSAAVVALLAVAALAAVVVREMARREVAEARLQDFADNASDWDWEMGPDLRFKFISPRMKAVTGIDPQSMIGKRRDDLAAPDIDREAFAQHLEDLRARRPFRNFIFVSVTREGRKRYTRTSGTPRFDRRGNFLGYRGLANDITAVMLAEEDARTNRRLLVDALESLPEGFAIFDAEDRLVACNRAFGGYHTKVSVAEPGIPFAEILHRSVATVIHPALFGDRPEEWIRWRLDRHRNPAEPIEIRYRDGRWARNIESRMSSGGIAHIRTDITDLKRHQEALRLRARQQEMLADFARLALAGGSLADLLERAAETAAEGLEAELCGVFELGAGDAGLVLRAGPGWSKGAIGTAGAAMRDDDPIGCALLGKEPVVVAELAAEAGLALPQFLAAHGVAASLCIAIRGGRPFGVLGAFARERRDFGRDEIAFCTAVAHSLAIAIEHKQDLALLAEQQTRLQGILDNTIDGLITIVEAGEIETANRAAARIFGHAEGELRGRSIDTLLQEPSAAPGDDILGRLRSDARAAVGASHEMRGLRKDGSTFPIDLALGEVALGERRLLVCTVRDISERRLAEQALHQAQKMEAVGQLTGGIAHDFNNFLTIIIGSADLLQEQLEDRPRLRALAETTLSAAERAAELTRRLLAFSRRQPLKPVALDLNGLVRGMGDLLRRTIGDDIEIETVLAGGLWRCLADPAQVETAILNLAVNARDAMAGGGKLTIETGNARLDEAYADANPDVKPGRYAMLAVTDTGSGMPPDVIARAFEPFFTTKPVGKGSGLGLSMIYGFARQSGGHAKIYSETGHGTTVKIYLPLADASASEARAAERLADPLPTGTETILAVEDDSMVRVHVVEQLRALGYRVVHAFDGSSALAKLDETGRVDLLLTDVVMPGGMNGRVLAEEARRRRPELKVLFTSGYTEDAIVHQGKLDPGVRLLSKPYKKTDLARKVREALED